MLTGAENKTTVSDQLDGDARVLRTPRARRQVRVQQCQDGAMVDENK